MHGPSADAEEVVRHLPESQDADRQRRPKTAVHVVATVVVGRWCGELDEVRMRRMLNRESASEADEPEEVLDQTEAHMPAAAG